MTGLLLSVPLLPLLAALGALLLPPRLRTAAGMLVAGATAWSLLALLLLHGRQMTLQAVWFESGNRVLEVGLAVDGLSWLAAVLVASVALAVVLYSIGYMADEDERPRFFAELGLFVGAMLTLVLASSLVLMFAAWEMVGLASYLLIGFHHHEQKAGVAAAKAFLMTRIGDVGFLIAWLLVFLVLRTTNITVLIANVAALPPALATLLALLFFAAAVGKSAQLPLSQWLPDAMVAPTPVSALLHSATMVAAGVYLLLRLYPLLAAAPLALDVIFWVGFATAAVTALLATAQADLKRILAWSTISQLGEMMLAIGLGAPLAAALHLVAHALFKSTLFMAAGSIDKYAGTRDLRAVGGLWRALPLTAACFAVAGLSLAGIQPLFTESSHDAIFTAALRAGMPQALGVLALLLLAGIYIGRAGVAVLAGPPRAPQRQAHEVRRSMRLGMVATAIGAALITLIIQALPPLLPFGELARSTLGEHITALLAGAIGLAIGGGSAWRRGAAPAIGRFPVRLESPIAAVARLPRQMAQHVATAIDTFERWLDTAARKFAQAFWIVAGGPNQAEEGGQRKYTGLQAVENMLDASGQALASAVRLAAGGTEYSESTAFYAGGDALARGLQAGGDRLRALQTGKLYLYTLGLFIWVLGVVLAAGLALLG